MSNKFYWNDPAFLEESKSFGFGFSFVQPCPTGGDLLRPVISLHLHLQNQVWSQPLSKKKIYDNVTLAQVLNRGFMEVI
jgi:hypothetical protein